VRPYAGEQADACDNGPRGKPRRGGRGLRQRLEATTAQPTSTVEAGVLSSVFAAARRRRRRSVGLSGRPRRQDRSRGTAAPPPVLPVVPGRKDRDRDDERQEGRQGALQRLFRDTRLRRRHRSNSQTVSSRGILTLAPVKYLST